MHGSAEDDLSPPGILSHLAYHLWVSFFNTTRGNQRVPLSPLNTDSRMAAVVSLQQDCHYVDNDSHCCLACIILPKCSCNKQHLNCSVELVKFACCIDIILRKLPCCGSTSFRSICLTVSTLLPYILLFYSYKNSLLGLTNLCCFNRF